MSNKTTSKTIKSMKKQHQKNIENECNLITITFGIGIILATIFICAIIATYIEITFTV